MSFSEEQIRKIARDELRKILDTGLMYTESNKNAPQQKTQQKLPELPPEIAEKLKINPDGTIQTIHYLYFDGWEEINNLLKAQGYKWISAGKESRWQT